MKKYILTLLITFLTLNCVYAKGSENPGKKAMQAMVKSHKYLHEVCTKAANNFRFDHQFAGYLRGRCLLYESDRQRLLNNIFPVTNHGEEDYIDNYPVLMSDFAIKMNNNEIESYKTIISEYCKHNKYKFAKKDPQACSEERINSLFISD